MKKIVSLACLFCCLVMMIAGDCGQAQEGPPVTPEIDAIETIKREKQALELSCGAYALMDQDSGTMLCSKEEDREVSPASITKIMTLLLIMEAIESGTLAYDTMITVSEHAASMGGSQVYLEVGEQLSVDDMLKCICIASANDACVAMAEAVSGSETAFVDAMNRRAKELGMEHTRFVNCCGLDTEGHYSSAKDIALMSRELMRTYPEITKYTTTWMDTIVHNTARGSKEFGLANTNKLIRSYTGITGLKTGSTGKALYCLSATAVRDDLKLIAVVVSAPDTKTRFREAAKLLDYGFANYYQYCDEEHMNMAYQVPICRALQKTVSGKLQEPFTMLLRKGVDEGEIAAEFRQKKLMAPVQEGEVIGELVFSYGQEEVRTIPVISTESVKRAGYLDYFRMLLDRFF